MPFVNYSGVDLPEASSSGPQIQGGGYGVLSGGPGNTYYIVGAGDRIAEDAGGGADNVLSWLSYQLPANVENLDVESHGAYAFGNNLDNIIIGGGGSQQIYGGLGQDVLVSTGTAPDVFIVRKGEGNDVIQGFDANDVVRLSGTPYYTFADLATAMSQVGADVRINLGGADALVLRNTSLGALNATNFELGIDTSRMVLTFNDDFNALSLWNNDGGRWRTDTTYGPLNSIDAHTLRGNNEAEFYTSPFYTGSDGRLSSNPFSVADGVLTIHASPATAAEQASMFGYGFKSGWISTEQSFAQTYGYFEIRAQLPEVQGMWPAFWLLRKDGAWPPEADVFENFGQNPNASVTTTHTNESGQHTANGEWDFSAPTSDGFHTWGMLWTATAITYYLDGAAVHTTPTPADMHQPMYMIANMAIGGMAGLPDAAFTGADYKIDYIRAYSLDPAATPAAPSPGAPPAAAISSGALVGTAGPDALTGGSGADTLDGNFGDDVLNGGAGSDLFIVRPGGHDTIYGFSSAGDHDILQLAGFNQYYPDVIAQTGADVYIHWSNGDTLLMVGVPLASLTAGNVIWT